MEDDQTIQIVRYARGTLSQGELQAEISAFLEASKNDGKLQEQVEAIGVPPDDIARQTESLEISQSQGITDQEIQIIIQGVSVAIKLWTDVILPWIRRRKGGNAVGQQQ